MFHRYSMDVSLFSDLVTDELFFTLLLVLRALNCTFELFSGVAASSNNVLDFSTSHIKPLRNFKGANLVNIPFN